MNWFKGTIAEAVTESKLKNAIFTVYVEGTDDVSKEMAKLLDNEKLRTQLESEKFVAVKIESGSEAYMQFSKIYQIVPFPSIFFIGKDGIPIQIVTGATKTIDEIDEVIQNVTGATKPIDKIDELIKTGSSATSAISSSSASFIQSEQAIGGQQPVLAEPDSEIVCEGGVCYKKPKDSSPHEAVSVAVSAPTVPLDDRVERAKKLIELQRKQKEEEEAREEREREIVRRKAGQDALTMKQRKEELELKNLKEERKREKEEEKAARKRILDQIKQDRAERAEKFGPIGGTSAEVEDPKPSTLNAVPQRQVDSGEFARIQFKKPTGEIDMHTFNSTDTFEIMRSYVQSNIVTSGDFSLATTYPKREFRNDDNARTLLELDLAPTAVILVLPITKKIPVIGDAVSRHGGGIWGLLMSIIYGLFITPLSTVFTYLSGWYNGRNATAVPSGVEVGAQKRAADDNTMSPNDAAKRRNLSFLTKQDNPPQPDNAGPSSSTGAVRRRPEGSNIHRLHESRDSDEDNNTWNGNSTQQQ